MTDNTMMNAINYVQENKLHKEANILANKVGDIYMSCIIIYKNIPQTKENLEMCKNIVKQKKEADKKAFYDVINGDGEANRSDISFRKKGEKHGRKNL